MKAKLELKFDFKKAKNDIEYTMDKVYNLLCDILCTNIEIDAACKSDDLMLETLNKLDSMIDSSIIDYKFKVHRIKNSDVTFVICYTQKGIKMGKSKCNPKDEFDIRIGKAIAICRAMNWNDMENKILKLLKED